MSGETLRIRRQMTQGNLLFGEYTLIHVLHQGPIGVICQAEHNSLKRPCALKMVHPGHTEREGVSLALVDTFLREARVMASVDHPHVVPIYHAGTVGQLPFIAMRWVRGGTLRTRMQDTGSVSIDWAMRLLRECAEGLRALHAAGFIHGAIEPDHILLEPDGSARISGFRQAISRESGRLAVSAPTTFQPSETRESLAADPRSDLWSLGATVAAAVGLRPEALTGTLSSADLVAAMLCSAPAASRNPQISAVGMILARLLEPRCDARYASAEELIDDCRRLGAGGEPIHALGRARHRKDHFVGRNPDGNTIESPFPE